MKIRITDSLGKSHVVQVEGEHHLDDVLRVIRDANHFVTFQVLDGGRILETAIAKEHIVGVTTLSDNAEDNNKRKGRQLLF